MLSAKFGEFCRKFNRLKKTRSSKKIYSFIFKTPRLFMNFMILDQKDKDWVLEYLSSGKGGIPYDDN